MSVTKCQAAGKVFLELPQHWVNDMLLFSFYRWRHWGLQELNNSSKGIQIKVGGQDLPLIPFTQGYVIIVSEAVKASPQIMNWELGQFSLWVCMIQTECCCSSSLNVFPKRRAYSSWSLALSLSLTIWLTTWPPSTLKFEIPSEVHVFLNFPLTFHENFGWYEYFPEILNNSREPLLPTPSLSSDEWN